MTKERAMTKEKPPSKNDQLIESFYMLARVVSQNTQLFKAVLNTFSQPEKPSAPTPPAEKKTEDPNELKDQMTEVLEDIVAKCGRVRAKQFLDSFDAKSISEVAPVNYEVFIKSGEYLVKQFKGDVI